VLFTEIDDVENFCSHVLRDSSKQLTICASGNRGYGSKMCTVMFDEFDALFLLFPELEMTVYRGRDEKISPEGRNIGWLTTAGYEERLNNPHLVIVQKLITSLCMKDL
jgi:hypothetical protein